MLAGVPLAFTLTLVPVLSTSRCSGPLDPRFTARVCWRPRLPVGAASRPIPRSNQIGIEPRRLSASLQAGQFLVLQVGHVGLLTRPGDRTGCTRGTNHSFCATEPFSALSFPVGDSSVRPDPGQRRELKPVESRE